MRSAIACLFAMLFGAANLPASAIELQLVADGLTAPVDLVSPRDGTGRLFVVEQHGVVHIMDKERSILPQPLLELRPNLLPLEQNFEERGLLGFALHPDFAVNGKLYVSYSAPLRSTAPSGWNHTRRISELTLTKDADTVDLASERILIELDWPSRKHNGGGLAFGPDGMLYIALGDGGGAHGVGKEVLWSAFEVPEQQRHWDGLAQDTSSLFGSILRIDVDKGFPGYAIPAGNPFIDHPGRDEIYAWGFRNPYRLAFDSAGSGAFLVTAVAETLWEAVYLISGPGNFGWPIREGTHCVDRATPYKPPADCPTHGPDGSPIRWPIVEYTNMQVMHPDSGIKEPGVGTAVVGARLYRGNAIPDWQGRLVVADWSAAFEQASGQLFLATPPTRWGAPWTMEKIEELDTRIISLAEDEAGELFVLTNKELGPYGSTGAIYQIRP